jgi:hypothetical protein
MLQISNLNSNNLILVSRNEKSYAQFVEKFFQNLKNIKFLRKNLKQYKYTFAYILGKK